MLNLRLVTWTTTVLTTLSYLFCVGVGLLMPHRLSMHHLLETFLPGFEWISAGAFLLGLVESSLWGLYVGGCFVLIYNALHRRLAGKAST